MSEDTRRLVYWPHTNITADIPVEIRNISVTDIGRGVAYSGKLVHPDHGEVGLIANGGAGGPTRFYPYTATYDHRDLEKLASQCFQDGVPFQENITGEPVENLLDEMFYEAECGREVDRMRRSHEFLVRTFTPASDLNGLPMRGGLVSIGSVITDRAGRDRLAASLDNDDSVRRRSSEEVWQMFDGHAWVPLLGERFYTEQQTTECLSSIRAHAAKAMSEYDNRGPLLDGFYVSGFQSARPGRYMLSDDPEIPGWKLKVGLWCPCRSRRKLTRFQRWTTEAGLIGSGVVHGAKNCLQLVCID